MKKILLVSILFSFVWAEPSAFDAGNLDSNNPYGLTKDEQHIFKNRKNIEKIFKLLNRQKKEIENQKTLINKLKLKNLNLNLEVESVSQKINGIETILSSVSDLRVDLNNLKQKVVFVDSFMKGLSADIDFLKKDLKSLKVVVDDNKKANVQNYKIIFGLVEKLALNLDKLSKKVDVVSGKVDIVSEKVQDIEKKNADFRNLPKNIIFNKALSSFKTGDYGKSQKMFNYLYQIRYKPATSLFYLGEIEYKMGHYKSALSFYKNSIKNYSKPTSFSAELLYHTGYSLEKIGNLVAAKKSYLKIINDFPDSIFVKYAKKRVENLEKTK
jgi:TolA-binding protein